MEQNNVLIYPLQTYSNYQKHFFELHACNIGKLSLNSVLRSKQWTTKQWTTKKNEKHQAD